MIASPRYGTTDLLPAGRESTQSAVNQTLEHVCRGVTQVMTQRGLPREAAHASDADLASGSKRGYWSAALRLLVWSTLALGLTACVHFANIVTLQGFPLGFYFAAQGIPIALIVMAFWWTRRAGLTQANLLQAGSQRAGALEAAAVILSPAIVILIAGELLQAGYDGLSTTLGIVAGLVLAIIAFSRLGWTSSAYSAQVSATPNQIATGNPPAILTGLLLAVCLIPLIAAHLLLALDLAGSLWLDETFGRHQILAGLAAIVLILAALPVAGLASAILTAAFLILAVAVLALAGMLALNAPDNPLSLPQITYGLALDQIKSLERSLILDGLADPAAMHQHSRPFTSWSDLNFSAFLLSAIFGTAGIAGVMLAAANRTASSMATSPAAAKSKPSPTSCASLTARALAWSGLMVLIVAITLPAISAFTKLEIYRSIANSISLEAQPDWLRFAHSTGAVRVCPPMPTETLPAASETAEFDLTQADPPPVDGAAELSSSEQAEGSESIDQASGTCAGPSPRLAADDIAIAADRAAIVSAAIAGAGTPGLHGILAALFAGVVAGAVGISRFAAGGIAGLRQPPGQPAIATAITALAIVSAATALALTWTSPVIDLAKISLSLLAAVLFPALAVAALRPTASHTAILFAALTGTAVTGYYVVGTTYLPQDFALQWQAFSSAPDWKYEELIRLMDACQDVDPSSCAAARVFAGDLANWWGLKTSASGVLGLPAGFLVGLLAATILPDKK